MNKKMLFFLFYNFVFLNFTKYYYNLSETHKNYVNNYIKYYPEEFQIINYIIM